MRLARCRNVFLLPAQVDDQMKLLQYSWSDMLVLDHLHQRLHNQLPDETTLPNGQKFDLLCLGLLGVASLADQFAALAHQFALLKFDVSDYICLKFLLLLNPGTGPVSELSEAVMWPIGVAHDMTLGSSFMASEI